MDVPIHIDERDDARAWSILIRHSPGMALRGRIYLVSEGATQALQEAGIRFERLDAHEPSARVEWLNVAERRLAELRSGQVVGIPAEDVLEHLRRVGSRR